MKRTHYTAAFKANIVVEALRETKTLSQIAAEHEINPALVTRWRMEAVADLPHVFERRAAKDEDAQASERQIAELYEQIGRLTTQVSWLKKKSGLDGVTRV